MHIVVLGRGKTGSLVAEVAHQRGHDVRVIGASQNEATRALTGDSLRDVDVVIDFTTPQAVRENMDACLKARVNLVVGTTGWYDSLPRVQEAAMRAQAGFLYAANFSIGINLLFEVVRAGAEALRHHYSGQIFERHHAQKKDAPSGTALQLQGLIRESAGKELEIISFREGEVVGMHEIVLDSPNDTIYLCHDAKSRRGYAEGAVRGAEWLSGKKGFYNFKDIWKELL
jgi:4-hydroxy-tetrahydrodipicolinate reductase